MLSAWIVMKNWKKHVDIEDKLTRQIAVSGQNREMYIINESGLYVLILLSKLPNTKYIFQGRGK